MLILNQLKIGHQNPINHKALTATFEVGSLVALLGRNGCGKTTLLRTIGRFLSPLAGHISLEQADISYLSAKQFSTQVSIVTTQRIQTPYLKVYDLIALGRHPYLGFMGMLKEEDHQLIHRILVTLEIQHLANKYVTACSDGEQQMVLLARALAQDTPVLLLDEATAHLDFVNRVKIFQTLQHLAKSYHKLIFLATHELEIALKFANQIVLFHKNEIQVDAATYFMEHRILQEVFAVEGLDYYF